MPIDLIESSLNEEGERVRKKSFYDLADVVLLNISWNILKPAMFLFGRQFLTARNISILHQPCSLIKEHKISVKFGSGFSFQRDKSEWLYPMYLKFKGKKCHWVYHILSLSEWTKLSQCLLCEAARYPRQMMCLLLLMMVGWWIIHWWSHTATSAALLS